MVQPKKRSRGDGNESQPSSADESQKVRKRLRAMANPKNMPKVDESLVEVLVNSLKSSLFMHHNRLVEIRSVVEEIDSENDRLAGVCKILDILQRPPAVHSFLSDMLLIFLTPEEALQLDCFDAHRDRMHVIDILTRSLVYQRLTKAKALTKGPLKNIHECASPDSIDPNSIHEAFFAWFGNDQRLGETILPLFADQSVDTSNVAIDDMEVVRSDFLNEHDADEFEVINWTDAFDADNQKGCTCSCHQDNGQSSGSLNNHCGLCTVKFIGESVFIWRGSRLVRAQMEFFDNEEAAAFDGDLDLTSNVSPTKLFSPDGGEGSAYGAEWAQVFRAVDSMEADHDVSGFATSSSRPIGLTSAATTPRKKDNGDSTTSNNDMLKHAFIETFGRNLWDTSSPVKRYNQNLGIGVQNDESNSTSFMFVRGTDGANTMLATMAADSNSSASASYMSTSFAYPSTSATSAYPQGAEFTQCPVGGGASMQTTSVVEETPQNGAEEEEETWTEEDDRYLLEQFKLHGNIYEAGNAAMTGLKKSRHAARDRLKLLLELLKETD